MNNTSRPNANLRDAQYRLNYLFKNRRGMKKARKATRSPRTATAAMERLPLLAESLLVVLAGGVGINPRDDCSAAAGSVVTGSLVGPAAGGKAVGDAAGAGVAAVMSTPVNGCDAG